MVIDSHVHFGDALNFSMPQKMVLDSMKKYSIDKIIVSNVQSTECGHDQKILPQEFQVSQLESAENAVQFATENPGKVFAAIWCKPLLETPDQEFVEFIEKNLSVIKSFKFHPFHSAICFDDYRVEKYVDVAKNLHLPVITHTGNGAYDNCELVLNMAKKFPEVNFVLAHLGLGTDNLHAIEVCKKQKNLYGDTAWVPYESAVKFIKSCGSERLLFGTDNPIDGADTYFRNPKGEPSMYQDYLHNLPGKIKSEDYENLMYKNASRLFGI